MLTFHSPSAGEREEGWFDSLKFPAVVGRLARLLETPSDELVLQAVACPARQRAVYVAELQRRNHSGSRLAGLRFSSARPHFPRAA